MPLIQVTGFSDGSGSVPVLIGCLTTRRRANVSGCSPSHRPASILVAAIPSARQWWIFISSARRSCYRPSMIQHSHSGRSRSSRRAITSATSR